MILILHCDLYSQFDVFGQKHKMESIVVLFKKCNWLVEETSTSKSHDSNFFSEGSSSKTDWKDLLLGREKLKELSGRI